MSSLSNMFDKPTKNVNVFPTEHQTFLLFLEFSVCPMSSVCRERMPQYFQRKSQSIYPCFLIQFHGYPTQMLSNHPSWMLEHILFQYSPYSARQEHHKRCPCLFGWVVWQTETAQSAAKVTVNGRHHYSFHQRLTQGAAGFKRRVVGSLRADHALAHEI